MREREDVSIPGLDVETIVEVVADAPIRFAALFGSYARGEQTDTSDLDIAVAFDESLTSQERTRARLALIERLSTELGMNDVDVVPFARMPDRLRQEILADGIRLRGSVDSVETDRDGAADDSEASKRRADFDELLAELERVV
jgi:predicted nucleotidyltransferase